MKTTLDSIGRAVAGRGVRGNELPPRQRRAPAYVRPREVILKELAFLQQGTVQIRRR